MCVHALFINKLRFQLSPPSRTIHMTAIGGIQELPAELILWICDLGAQSLLEAAEAVARGGLWPDAFVLPELKSVFAHYIALSGVCKLWQSLLMSHPNAWKHLRLTHGSDHSSECGIISIFDRCPNQPIYLECVLNDPSIQDNKQIRAYGKALKESITPYVHRIESLRLVGLRDFFVEILSAFASPETDANIVSGTTSIPLSRLQIMQPPSEGACIGLGQLRLQNLNVAPSLSHLRVRNLRLDGCSTWRMKQIVLEGDSVMEFVENPRSQAPMDLVVIGHWSTAGVTLEIIRRTALWISDMQDCVETPIPLLDIGRMYFVFFNRALLRGINTLKLAKLNDQAMRFFIKAVREMPNLTSTRRYLRNLYFENLRLDEDDEETLAGAFPEVSALELVNVRPRNEFLNLWKGTHGYRGDIWPLLEEVKVDGQLLRRDITLR